ncbi:MAG: thiol-disulfide isomerase [Syntrophus sp. (in: bacteria)]|nr:thiol-disulfide isomerase [Syntrophus sp. (in: bacteria)]
MVMKKGKTSTEEFEKAAAKQERAKYVLRLYVAGMTPGSTLAIANVQKFCEEHLEGHYELEVIDIYQQPKLAKVEQIIATPTLIKKLPLPLRRFIGNMSDKERFLVGIDLKSKNFRSQKSGVRMRMPAMRFEDEVSTRTSEVRSQESE